MAGSEVSPSSPQLHCLAATGHLFLNQTALLRGGCGRRLSRRRVGTLEIIVLPHLTAGESQPQRAMVAYARSHSCWRSWTEPAQATLEGCTCGLEEEWGLGMKVSKAEEESLRGAPSLSEACSYYRHGSTETTRVALPEHPEPLLGNVALLCSSGAGRGPAGPNGSLEFCLD